MALLTDKKIINDCGLENIDNIPVFLSKEVRDKVISFLSGCKDQFLPRNIIDELKEIWSDLLRDAITYLKSKDKRENPAGLETNRDSVAFGIDALSRYFDEYGEFEAFLYSDKFYRDHVMHVFRVWLVGIWLLKKIPIRFDKEISGDLTISEEEIHAMWCIIALTHDLGYPLDKVEKVIGKIESMMTYFGGNEKTDISFRIPTHHHFINDFILSFISSKLIVSNNEKQTYQTKKQSKFYLKFSKSFEVFDHGIISCILLMKNLVYFLESDFDLGRPFSENEDARQFYIRREILRSIASHTCTDIYHLFSDTMSFLLILADELQVWERPTFLALKGGNSGSISVNVHEPTILKDSITLNFEIIWEGTVFPNDEIRKFVFVFFRKWHKWFRSALGAHERTFDITLNCKVKEKISYTFKSERNKLPELIIDGENHELREIW